jgi:hypothetical protein
MSESIQTPQIPVKVDQRKIMTPEKEERLRLAREVRAKNRLMREEKRMELAKQMILSSVTPGPGISNQGGTCALKAMQEEKKLKWEARKGELLAEMRKMMLTEGKPERPTKVPESESDSEVSEIEEPPAKRPKKEKKSKSAPVPKPKPSKTKRSQSHTASKDRSAKHNRKPVQPAVVSDSDSSDDSEMSEVEHENVLQLW